MGKKVDKINNLIKTESFLQLDFSRGFKYIDKAGEFLNNIYEGDTAPPYAMNPDEMLVKISDKIELKVSPNNLWIHFIKPNDFSSQRQTFFEKANLVHNLFEPEQYTRIGWRHYLIYECGENYPVIEISKSLDLEINEVLFSKKFNNFQSRINISKAISNKDDGKVIILDIDIFKVESFNNVSNTNKLLTDIENIYTSNELLKTINTLLK